MMQRVTVNVKVRQKLHPDVNAAVIVAGFNESLDMLETEGRNIAGDVTEESCIERYLSTIFDYVLKICKYVHREIRCIF